MKRDNSALLVVNYHYVRKRKQYRYPGIHPIESEEFVEQVRWLKGRYHMATPEELEAFVCGKGKLPGPSVFLTFDDGLSEHGKLAKEILESLGIRGAFFISSRPLVEYRASMVHKIHWLRATMPPERFREQFFGLLPAEVSHGLLEDATNDEAFRTYLYDTPENARLKYMINFQLPMEMVDSVASEMLKYRHISEPEFCKETYMGESDILRLSEAGHVIGSHGHSHMPFSRLDTDSFVAELRMNILYIERITGVKPCWISYPYGTHSSIPSNTGRICEELGFTVGFCLDKEQRRWNTGEESPYRVDRINTNHVTELCS